ENQPLVGPIYQSVKFTVKNFSDLGNHDSFYFYSRASNPTVRQLELLLAQLQGREDAMALGSGVAALSVPLLSLLRQGDHVIMFLESYLPTRYLVATFLKKFGVTSSLISLSDSDSLKKAIQPGKTKLLILESPTNPMTRVPDFGPILELTQKHQI